MNTSLRTARKAATRSIARAAEHGTAFAVFELLDSRIQMSASNFSLGLSITTGDKPVDAVFADLNGDGKSDLVVACAGSGSKGIWVHLADPTTGAITSGTRYATTDPTEEIVLDDFNRDGNVDIAFATGGALNNLGLPVLNGLKTLEVYAGNGAGGFTPFTAVSLPTGANDLATGDYNNDGISDVAVTNSITNTIAVMITNPADGTLGTPRTRPTALGPNGVVAGDFNEDGKTDLIVTSLSAIQFFAGTGNGDIGAGVNIRTSLNLSAALAIVTPTVSDLNGDGHLDLALAGLSSTVKTLLGSGSGAFSDGTASTLLPSANVNGLAYGDLNNDGINDLVGLDKFSDNLLVETLNADGTIASVAEFAAGAGASAVKLLDINGDWKLDMVSVDESADSIRILTNITAGVSVGRYDLTNHALYINGTSGDDTIVVETFATQIVVTRNGVRATYNNEDIRSIIIDTFDGNDLIDASALARSVYVQGGGGNDTIIGTQANDRLRGGLGNDSITGGLGDDRIEGYKGWDTLRGSEGSDRLYGDDGKDMLDGGSGTDRLYGGFGNDTLIGGAGNDGLFGNEGDDWLFGNAGRDNLDGGLGKDRGDQSLEELTVSIELLLSTKRK